MELKVMPEYRFEFEPYDIPPDETAYGLRAYLDSLSDEKLANYNSSMTDDELMNWDGNFTSDGNLFLVCCERDVDAAEFRRELEGCIAYRKRISQ